MEISRFQGKILIINMKKDPEHHSNVKQAIPFFMVTSMEKSLNFYQEGLGFELKEKWEPNGKVEWCAIQLGGASIMLQSFNEKTPNVKLGEGVSVYFICEDALQIYTELKSRGLSPKEPFVGNNMWVVGIKDPDGYELFFESLTKVPEGTRYTDWKKIA